MSLGSKGLRFATPRIPRHQWWIIFPFMTNLVITTIGIIATLVAGTPSLLSRIVAIIAGIIFICCIGLSFLLISRKVLIYSVTNLISVLSDMVFSLISRSTFEKITIYYNSQQIPNLHIALLKIQNNGNTEIDQKDFVENPLIFNFPADIQLLDVAIKEMSIQATSIPKSTFTDSNVIIQPFTLATAEWFEVKVLFVFKGQDVVQKLREIKVLDKSKYTFDTFMADDWWQKYEKRIKRQDTSLVFVLSILNALSISICIYTWFFLSNPGPLSFPVTLLLTCLISILYFGLVISLIINTITPKPSF